MRFAFKLGEKNKMVKTKYKVNFYIGGERKIRTSRKKFRGIKSARNYCKKLRSRNPKIRRCSPTKI